MIMHGDCLDIMPTLADKSVDMILCDLPYGSTACKWDTVIPFEPLWAQYKRLIKDNGAIVLTASQPFTSALVMSNIKMFKYEWIWHKNTMCNFPMIKGSPGKVHENIIVFSNGTIPRHNGSPMNYNPQGLHKINKEVVYDYGGDNEFMPGRVRKLKNGVQTHTGYPVSVLKINTIGERLHPTQKPVALFEYLIRTYTNEGDTVMDNCAGSFTTAIACINTNRKYICIEKDEKYFEIGKNRIENHQPL
jgi:site-specific DNA-methyltransferase (adenine-specific)